MCCILIGMLLLLCACQPTPEVDAVKQKDTNILIETVRNEQTAQQDEPHAEEEMLPERFCLNETTSRENVRIKADVPIEVLSDTGAFPVLRVEHRYLSDNERLTLAKRLLNCETLYIWEYHETRESIETMIREYMRELSPEEKETWMREMDASEEDFQEMLARRENLAEQYQKKYNELPADETTVPLTAWDGSVPAYSEDFSQSNSVLIVGGAKDTGPQWSVPHIEAWSNGGNSPFTYQIAGNDGGDVTNAAFFNCADSPDAVRIARNDYDQPYGDARVTPNDAFRLVQSYFDGIATFAISDVYWTSNRESEGEVEGGDSNMKRIRYAYVLHGSTVYHGAFQPYCATPAFDMDSTAAYAIPWNYETLTAVVDGDGNLISLLWQSALNVTETISENAALLPFSKIQEIFSSQIGRMFMLQSEVNVTSVQLGLFRIREKNNLESGLLVPAWYFTGAFQPTDAQTNSSSDVIRYDPLLIINAIDGSIIDAKNGY